VRFTRWERRERKDASNIKLVPRTTVETKQKPKLKIKKSKIGMSATTRRKFVVYYRVENIKNMDTTRAGSRSTLLSARRNLYS
jgi:hypothetical protein